MTKYGKMGWLVAWQWWGDGMFKWLWVNWVINLVWWWFKLEVGLVTAAGLSLHPIVAAFSWFLLQYFPPPPMAGWSLKEIRDWLSSWRMTASFVTGRLNVEVKVFSVTTLTMPSLPGKVSVTRARGQWLVKSMSSRMMTMSPSWMFGWRFFHFCRRCSCWRYSADQRCQKSCTIAWHMFQRLGRDGSMVIKISG